MLGVSQEYQGGQWGGGQSLQGENKRDEGQRGMGCRSYRISAFHSTSISFYSACGQNQQRVLFLSHAEQFQLCSEAQVGAGPERPQGRATQSGFVKNSAIQVETGLSRKGFCTSCHKNTALCILLHVCTWTLKGSYHTRTLKLLLFSPTCLFIQQAFSGLLDMSWATLSPGPPW